MSVYLSSSEDYEALLDQYDTWLFDCDGVLWRGDQVVDGVVQVLHILRKRGMFYFFTIPPLTHLLSCCRCFPLISSLYFFLFLF